MATVQNNIGDVEISGNLRVGGTFSPTLAKTDVLAEESLQSFTIPMTIWRKDDGYATALTAAAALTDDLGLYGQTFNTNAPSLRSSDFGGNAFGGNPTPQSHYARGEIVLPWEYVPGGSVTIRLHAGMLITVADQSCTVDVEVYKSDRDSTVTGDLYSGLAQNINSLVFSDVDFALTSSALSPGDLLDVRINVAGHDDTDAGVMIGCIGSVQLLCDVR